MADEIAQRHHDIEDAIFMNIIEREELVGKIKELFEEDHMDSEDKEIFEKLGNNLQNDLFLSFVSKLIVGILNKKLIKNSRYQMKQFIKEKDIKRRNDFIRVYPQLNPDNIENIVAFCPKFADSDEKFKDYLKNRILNSFEVQRMDGKGRFIIRSLFKAYLTNPRQLHDNAIINVFRIYEPDRYETWPDKANLGKMRNEIDKLRCNKFQIALLRGICDYIAGMTDSFAISEYEKLYGGQIIMT